MKQFTFESKTAFSNGIEAAKETKRKIVSFAAEIENSPDEKIIEVI